MSKQEKTIKNTNISTTTRKSRTSGTSTPLTTPTQDTNNLPDNICTQTNKQYLQNLLQQYTQTKDINLLDRVAYSVVKKVCLRYAPNNAQTMQLYNDSRRPNTQNQDIKDLRQVAIYSILEQLHQQKDTPQQIDYTQVFKTTFQAIHKYLYQLRGIQLPQRPFDYSIEQLRENNIDILVNIRKGVNQLVKDSNITNLNDYTDNNTSDNNDDNNIKRQLVIDILRTLTPTQKQIAKLLALGLSQRQIASKLNRSKTTIDEHIKYIRKKATQIANNR